MGRAQDLRVVDPVLTQLARGYVNGEMVGVHLFPLVMVEKEAGKIPGFGKEAFRLYNTERAMRANSNKIPVEGRSVIDYATAEQDAVYPIDYRELTEDIINTEKLGTHITQSAIQLKHEFQCAIAAITPGNYPAGSKVTLAGATQFTHADSDPIKVIATAKAAIRSKIAKRPNTMVMGAATFEVLQNHPKIIERIKYTQTGVVTVDLLKSLFDVKNMYIADAVYVNDADTTLDIWGDNIVLAYVPEQKTDAERSVFEPSFGYTIRKKDHPQIDTYNEDGGKIRNIRATDNFVVKIVGADAGYLISDTNA